MIYHYIKGVFCYEQNRTEQNRTEQNRTDNIINNNKILKERTILKT